jgi:hypothetical protein
MDFKEKPKTRFKDTDKLSKKEARSLMELRHAS